MPPPILPPFTPPRPHNYRLPSPTVSMETFYEGSVIAVGCELIVRGVTPRTGLTAADIVRKTIEDATISTMEHTLRIRDLELFKVLVSSAGARAERDTFCYVRISADVAAGSTDPRPDLLEKWIDILPTLNSQWSVEWSPQKAGRDKSTWVAIHGLVGLDPNAKSEFRQTISSQLEHLGYAVSSCWPMDNGNSVGVIMHNREDASRIRQSSPLTIPSLSPHPITVTTPFKQIQPIYAFELVILGISSYDPTIQSTLDNYFIHRSKDDSGTTAFVSSRTIWEADAYCFLMRDWQTMAKALTDTAMFDSFMANYHVELQYPQLVYRANTDNTLTTRQPVALRQAGDQVMKTLQDLDRKVETLRREQATQFNAIDRRFAIMEDGAQRMVTMIKDVATDMTNTRHAVMAQFSQNLIVNCIQMKERQLKRLEDKIKFAAGEERDRLNEEAKAVIDEIARDEDNKDAEDEVARSSPFTPTIPPPPGLLPATPTRSSASVTTGLVTQVPSNSMMCAPLTPPTSIVKAKKHHQSEPESPTPRLRTITKTDMDVDDGGEDDEEEMIGVAKTLNEKDDAAPVVCLSVASGVPASSNAALFSGLRLGYPVFVTTMAFLLYFLLGLLDNIRVQIYSTTFMLYRLIWYTLSTTKFALPFSNIRSFDSIPGRLPRFFSFCYPINNFLLAKYLVLSIWLLTWGPKLSLASPAFSVPAASLSFYALNANGMNHALKIQHINTAIRFRNPAIFVISELKSKTSTMDKLLTSDYNIFEEKSEPTTGTWKWGLTVGVRKDIQVGQRLQITEAALKARLIGLDLLLPSSDGGGFTHRVFGVYAPWNPGGEGLTSQFWPKVTELCNASPHSWTLLGDLNATVSPAERQGSENRTPYLNFLRNTNGKDLWKQYPLRNRLLDWTCRAKDSDKGGSIIDRVVTSAFGIVEAQLQVATKPNDYIPVTDHRPIIAYIIPNPPNGTFLASLSALQMPKPRIRYPRANEKHLFRLFEQKTEEILAYLTIRLPMMILSYGCITNSPISS